MPVRDWKLRVEDILEAILKIQRYVSGYDLEKFTADEKTIDAVVRNLEVIGEASRNIPDEVISKYPELPWAEMRGMRNVLVHEYFGVSVQILWYTIQENLPPVIPLLQRMLAEESRESS